MLWKVHVPPHPRVSHVLLLWMFLLMLAPVLNNMLLLLFHGVFSCVTLSADDGLWYSSPSTIPGIPHASSAFCSLLSGFHIFHFTHILRTFLMVAWEMMHRSSFFDTSHAETVSPSTDSGAGAGILVRSRFP